MPIELRKILPTGFRFRELWLPAHSNNNATLPSSVNGGKPLTQTGSQGRTTADGVKFDATVNGTINCGAIHSAAASLWVSIRFKLPSAHGAGTGIRVLFAKETDINNSFYARLENDGKLFLVNRNGGVYNIAIGSTEVAWAANTWHHVLVSLYDTGAQTNARIVVNGGAATTAADVARTPIVNGGNFIFGLRTSEGQVFDGIDANIVMGTDLLTAAEETDLYKGVSPSDAVNRYCLDEGMGATVYDRGSGGNNGTLGSGCSWAFGGCKRPVLSLDGINDYAASAVGVANVTPPVTITWVGKLGSTYTGLSRDVNFWLLYADGNNFLRLGYNQGTNKIHIIGFGSGVGGFGNFTPSFNIGQYVVLTCVYDAAGNGILYQNGVAVASMAGIGAFMGLARVIIGNDTPPPSIMDVSKTLWLDVVHGALPSSQVLNLSRYLDQKLKMGIGI